MSLPICTDPRAAKSVTDATSIVFGLVPFGIAFVSVESYVCHGGFASFGTLSENWITVPPRAARISESSSRLKSYA